MPSRKKRKQGVFAGETVADDDQRNVEKSRAIEPLNVGFNSRVKRLVPSEDGGVVRRHRFSKVENSWTAECELRTGL